MKLLCKIGKILGYSVIAVIVFWISALIIGFLILASKVVIEALTEVLR